MKDLVRLVRPKNALKVMQLTNELTTYAMETINTIVSPDERWQMRFDTNLILFVCNLIETGVDKNKSTAHEKVDKKELFFSIYERCLGDGKTLTDEDKRIISSTIEMLHDQSIIKKIGWIKQAKQLGKKLLEYLLKL